MQDGAGFADGFCYNTIFMTDLTRGGIVFAQQYVNVWINEANKLYKLYPQWFDSGPAVTGGDVTRSGTPNKERKPEEKVYNSGFVVAHKHLELVQECTKYPQKRKLKKSL